MPVLEIENLTMRFGGLTAIKQFDLRVENGQIFSVIGPNGAGKTTVFNVVTGIYEPTQGRIKLCGHFEGQPFTWGRLLFWVFIGLTTGIGTLVFAVNINDLWRAAIPRNVEPSDFSLATALEHSIRYIHEAGKETLAWISFLAGSVIGFLGSFAIWRRSRRTPEVIARAGIARTFQNIRLFQNMTVLENVLVGLDRTFPPGVRGLVSGALGLKGRERQAVVKAFEHLSFVGLSGVANELAKNLPYGDQRRLEIARALATDPKLLLLDEPAAGMNPSESADLMVLIGRIRAQGITILLIEHHMSIVMGISDRIAVLDYGVKIAEGTPEEVRNNPAVIEAYLGKEEVT